MRTQAALTDALTDNDLFGVSVAFLGTLGGRPALAIGTDMDDWQGVGGVLLLSLQPLVYNTAAPVSVAKEVRGTLAALKAAPKTMSSKAVHKPISLRDSSGRGDKNEIFVDVIDRISATFNSNGQVRTFTIDGSIQMKSYLTGSPQLHLALNDQLVIAGGGHAGYGMVELDNVNFHECVDLGKFEQERMLVLEPPHCEFVLMNFHIGSLRHEGQIPFRVSPMLSAVSEYKQELRLQIRAEFADKFHGANVKVTFTVPKSSTGATCELAPGAKQQSTEYDDATKTVSWMIRKFPGGSVQALFRTRRVGSTCSAVTQSSAADSLEGAGLGSVTSSESQTRNLLIPRAAC